MTANNSTTNNVVFFFVSDLKNSKLKQILIADHKREKIFRVTIYLETKSFKIVSTH